MLPFDALGGTLVGVALGDPLAVPAPIPGFELDLGQVSGGDADGDGATTPDVSFTNADAVSLQLNNVSVFAGVGGVLTLVGTADDYSLSTVAPAVDALGFWGSVTSLDLLAITDGHGSLPGS